MPVRPDFSGIFFRIFDYDLHICFTVIIRIDPIDNQVPLSTINSIFITVNQQTIIDHISLNIPFFHVTVVI